MDLRFTDAEERFRAEVRDWLEERLSGPFAALRGVGGPGDETAALDDRLEWERELGRGGWIGLSWPVEGGGRGASLAEQVIFNEEYVRARAPGRMGHIGETLLAPTVIAFGDKALQERVIPPIRAGEAMWCQGYSEPGAGSDLANVQTRARRDGDHYVIDGQKVWTSHAAWADACFVVARTDPGSQRHKGLSYLLVPMDQPGITVRPIRQITGDAEFFEVFFDGARAPVADRVGAEGDGWRVALGTLAFERGASTLGQQLGFEAELREITELARRNGAWEDALLRDRLSRAWMGLKILRLNALRTLTQASRGELAPEALILKLSWATWHRDLGELAMDVAGADGALLEGGELTAAQRLFLFSRADTIYAGTNQVQRTLIAERALGLPRGPR